MSESQLIEKLQQYGSKKGRYENDLLNSSQECSYKISTSPRFHKYHQSPVIHQSPANVSSSLEHYPFDKEEMQIKDPQGEIRFLLNIIDQLQYDLQIQYNDSELIKKKYQELQYQVQKMQSNVYKEQEQYETKQYCDQLEKQNRQLNNENNTLKKNQQEVQQKYLDCQKDLDNLKLNASELLIQNEGLYSLLNSLKEKHQFDIDSQAKHFELINQKKIDDEINVVQKQYKREIETQNSISDSYKNKIEDLTNECQIKSKKLSQQQEINLKQELEIEILNGKLIRYQKLEQELVDIDTLFQQKNRTCQQLVQENQKLGEELKNQKQQIQQLDSSFKLQQNLLEKERNDYIERIKQLQKQLDELQNVNNEFKKKELEQQRLLNKLSEYGDENIRLLEQNTFILDKTNDTETLRVNYKNLVKRYYQLKSENDGLVYSINQHLTNSAILQRQLQNAIIEKNEVITNLHYTQQQLLNLQYSLSH
ncbi:unnamed protein product [Paramecium primaurelia]|uniref:Uncharacterized protein n=1 Tax=Paramecium primaurelia TaxID=5886 RepID=A0A8S1LFM4_PARPR|nr:unnamed protein product [Paramecium primaurelia]